MTPEKRGARRAARAVAGGPPACLTVRRAPPTHTFTPARATHPRAASVVSQLLPRGAPSRAPSTPLSPARQPPTATHRATRRGRRQGREGFEPRGCGKRARLRAREREEASLSPSRGGPRRSRAPRGPFLRLARRGAEGSRGAAPGGGAARAAPAWGSARAREGGANEAGGARAFARACFLRVRPAVHHLAAPTPARRLDPFSPPRLGPRCTSRRSSSPRRARRASPRTAPRGCRPRPARRWACASWRRYSGERHAPTATAR